MDLSRGQQLWSAVAKVGGRPMSTEECAVCGEVVGFHHTVHVMFHTGGDEGVVDHYVCRQCYDGELAPLFEAGAEIEAEEQTATPDGSADPDENADYGGEQDEPDDPDEKADEEEQADEGNEEGQADEKAGEDAQADEGGEEATPDE